MIPYGTKRIALFCIDAVRAEFLDIYNMNTEHNEAKHLKIERETSANFPNQFGFSINAFEFCIGLGNIYKSIKSLQQRKNLALLRWKNGSFFNGHVHLSFLISKAGNHLNKFKFISSEHTGKDRYNNNLPLSIQQIG